MDPTSLQNTSTTSPVFTTLGAEWEILSPIHIVLSIYITFQNSLVIHHYLSDWKRISSFLFILIAAADIGNALSEIGTVNIVNPFYRLSKWFIGLWVKQLQPLKNRLRAA